MDRIHPLACKMYTSSKNAKIKERIGEQQQTLSTMIEILGAYNKSKQNDELISSLKDLKTEFDKIKVDYTYVAPKTDAKNKVTTLQHDISVEISDDVMSAINTKVNNLRESVIK